MQDLRKLLDLLNETTAGAVASVAQPLGATVKRTDEGDADTKTPDVLEYGNWENSAVATSSKLKQERQKSAKVVKSIYGEDVQAEAKNPAQQAAIAIAKKEAVKESKALADKLAAKLKGKVEKHNKDRKETGEKVKAAHQKELQKKDVEEGKDWSPGAKETINKDKIVSLKNLIAKYKEKGNTAKVRELQTELKSLQTVAEGSDKLQGTPVVSLSDFDDKDNKKNKYGQTVPKKLKKDDPRVKFHKDEKKGVAEGELNEDDLILVPGQGHKLKPGFIPHGMDRTDHEVEMARSDLYQAGKNALMVLKLIKDRSEEEGLEGWVQEKIIKAADYLNTIREYLESKHVTGEGLAGAALGGIAGGVLTKTPSGALAGANIGSEIQDALSGEQADESMDGVAPGTRQFTSEEDMEEGVVDTIKKAGGKALDLFGGPGDEELKRLLQKRMGVPQSAQHGKPAGATPRDVKEEEVEESGLQAYLGNKKYGKEGMDALRKAGREGASKEKMAQIRAKYDKLDEVDMAEDSDPCWSTHKQVGMKKKGDRMVPNCVPKESQEKIGGKHDPDEFDAMVQRLGQKAKEGPRKTVWDPVKRVYKTVPVNAPEKDVDEGKTGPGLWANIHAKRERIKKGSGERMRSPGEKGAPSAADLRAARSDKK